MSGAAVPLEDLVGDVQGVHRDRVAALMESQSILWRKPSGWAVVPRFGTSGEWLVVASDTEGERRAHEQIRAFVGPSVGELEVGARMLDKGSVVDRDLAKAHPLVTQLRVHDVAAALDAVEYMTAVRATEPELTRPPQVPIGFLVRDFRLALGAGDDQAAERLLRLLEDSAVLSSDNLRFLRVERLARLGRWFELGETPFFNDLARARRPRHVTEWMLEALWRREFDDPSLWVRPGAALERFVDRALDAQYAALLGTVDVPSSTSGRRIVWLAAYAAGNKERAGRVIAATDESERALLASLVGAQPLTDQTALDQQTLFDDGDFPGVIAFAERDEGDTRAVALAVRAAFESGDVELAARAMELVSASDRAALPLTPGFVRSLQSVEALAAAECVGWAHWMQRVATSPWPDAAEIARNNYLSWDGGVLRASASAASIANYLLTSVGGMNAGQVRAVLDLLCDLAASAIDSPAAWPFAEALLLVLSEEESPSLQVRTAFFSLAADVMAAGPTQPAYRDLVATATRLWQRVRSRETLGWALDMCDLLAGNPCHDDAARANFFTTVNVDAAPLVDVVPEYQVALLKALGREVGVPIVLPQRAAVVKGGGEEVWPLLSGKVVGLYSLLGGAGARFAARIGELNPLAKAIHNADHVATDTLRNMAKAADFLIVDTRHASHAATAAIDAVRPKRRQLFPAGRGLSSFIAALHEALTSERSSLVSS